uniref:U17-Austrotoxin-Ht1h_1 n=1 Tax=Hickmania troglodytes TaxID=489260 RepID=A0A482Z5K2_9ARAC
MKVFMCLALLSALVIVTQASSDEIEQAGYLSADWDSFLNATSEIDWNAVKDEINDKLNNRNKCTGKGCGVGVLLQTNLLHQTSLLYAVLVDVVVVVVVEVVDPSNRSSCQDKLEALAQPKIQISMTQKEYVVKQD